MQIMDQLQGNTTPESHMVVCTSVSCGGRRGTADTQDGETRAVASSWKQDKKKEPQKSTQDAVSGGNDTIY